MKTLKLAFAIILVSVFSFSCQNIKEKKNIEFRKSKDALDTVKITSSAKNISIETPSFDKVENSHSTPIKNTLPSKYELSKPENNTITNNIAKDIVSLENNNLSLEIKNLSILLNQYNSAEFPDCISLEKAITEFTDKFFSVIEKINISDSISINSIKLMEGFAEVFEPEFDRVENECPDLYNDYMEYLDDYTDLYYSKLEIIFAEDSVQ